MKGRHLRCDGGCATAEEENGEERGKCKSKHGDSPLAQVVGDSAEIIGKAGAREMSMPTATVEADGRRSAGRLAGMGEAGES